ncbi:putative mannan synthase 7 [Raphanus sativus]|uniref:glucomannan 4-beta-mannosyltransferase n=1 Tax=Raphanus sativus TaxID=3726 RepID=A0A9W3DKK3_RAPSA|nr:glucomannan 4-beta-mannosyltransferase 7 isoform X2 [Raphanus sativus]KAJ4903666.1 putative mannan synthase 7 [Raphanus sativus]
MSPLTSFHRIAHDKFSSLLLSLSQVRSSKAFFHAFKSMPASEDVVVTRISLWWEQARALVVVPVFEFLVALCLIMSVMYFVEVLCMGIVVAYVKLFKRKPEKVYKWEAMEEDDVECSSESFPMVLVQIPMYNEKEVCEQSIAAACKISWPSNRIIIQVLDDSTDSASKELVRQECERWSREGVNITFEIRDNRNGYKAGALREGMKHSYVKQCDYIAIFDADFQPDPDFLHRTVPFLIHNPNLALVQGRWEFVNADQCMMTRLQEMSLGYHFTVEQQVGSSTFAFFGFNGTAGVWRISALNESGGWNDQTTVEDMDIAVRATLRGWKLLYIDDLKVKSELPCSFNALRSQQHRWTCGPANLFRKMAGEIIRSENVSLGKKLYMLYSFFFMRKVVAHILTFCFYCVILPATVLFPEVTVPKWAAFYLPALITLFIAVGKPRSIYLLVFWVLFENAMSMLRTKALVMGLFETGRVQEWVVTEKLGDGLKTKLIAQVHNEPHVRFRDRVHVLELVLGAYLLFCGCYDIIYGKNTLYLYVYLLLQSTAFFVVGFGFVGK